MTERKTEEASNKPCRKQRLRQLLERHCIRQVVLVVPKAAWMESVRLVTEVQARSRVLFETVDRENQPRSRW